MGMNVGANVLTSGGLGLTMILLLVTGIMLVIASNKLKEVPEFEGSTDLNNANSNLKTAYFLFFIATAISLILGILYAGHESAWCLSEWIHGVLYLLLYIAVVIGVIYAFLALNKIYTPELENNNGSAAFIWAALLIGSLAFITMTAVGSGRVGYGVSRNSATHRLRHAEHKLHEMHSAVTGLQNDFPGHKDRCGSEQQCGMEAAPAPVMMVEQPSRLPPVPAQVSVQTYPTQNYQPVQSYQNVRTYPSAQSVNYQPPTQSFVGAPTVTRHSVVTTSQPVVTTSSPRMRQSALAQSVNQSMNQSMGQGMGDNAGFI